MILLKNKDKKANIKIGNNIEIKDGSDFPFDLTLYGRSTQETRSGKNLFDISKVVSNWNISTNIGVRNNNDGTLTISAPSTSSSVQALAPNKLSDYCPNLKVGDVVYLNATTTGTQKYIYLITSASVWSFGSSARTITQNDLDSGVLWYSSGANTTATISDIMISTDGGEYEPYGVMPSPDYPSPIESIGRKNLFDVTLDGSITNEIQYKTYMLKPNTKYTISTNTYLSNDVIANIFIDLGKSLTPITSTNGVKGSKTITTDSTGYVTIGYRNYSMQLDYSTGMYYCQLEKGSSATNYVPYEHTEISATVTGKNLIPFTNQDFTLKNVRYYVENGNLYLNGTSTGETSSVDSAFKTNFSFTLPSGTYTISHKTGINSCYIYKSDNTLIKTLGTDTVSQTFTLSEETKLFIGFYVYQKTFTNVNTEIMISTDGGEYKPYQENITNIDLQGNELCSLPNGTKDELVVENGIAKIIKKVGKIVLDGSEDWAEYTSQTSDGYRVYETTKPAGPSTSFWVNNGAYSNYFKATNGFNIKNSITGTKYGIYVNIDNTITNTIATFKTWLSTHNTEVYYALAEPETINLGTVEMPHTYEGVSNITNSADTEMVVKYYKKFEFDKILRSGYNIDEQEYEIAKKQMANGKRKKILSSYVDCIIKIDLGLLDNKTYQEYKEQLEDGEYEYWSYKYNQYKKANFILTKPSITTEYAYDDEIGIDDMEITLEKSSDVS